MSEQRLVEIETKISHQDFLIENLNQVIYQQQLTIDDLEKKLKYLVDRLKDYGSPGLDIRTGHEKPPHY